MAKQKAQNLLREKLLKLPITLRFEKFILKTIFCLARADEEYLEKVLRLVAPSEDLPQLAQTQSFRHLLIQKIKSLNEEQIETIIDQRAKFVAENRPYDLSYVYYMIKFGE